VRATAKDVIFVRGYYLRVGCQASLRASEKNGRNNGDGMMQRPEFLVPDALASQPCMRGRLCMIAGYLSD
jgi:hypothetical protein